MLKRNLISGQTQKIKIYKKKSSQLPTTKNTFLCQKEDDFK